MNTKRVWMAILAVIMALTVDAAAQKNELGLLIGRTFVSNQQLAPAPIVNNRINFGNGLTFQGNYARRLVGLNLATIYVEVPFAYNNEQKLNSGNTAIPANYRAWFLTPAVRLNFFSSTAIQPWLSFGGGFGHFRESNKLEFGGTNPGKTGTSTGVIQYGAGLDVKVYRSFSLRGELRDFNSGVPQLNVVTGKTRQHNLLLMGGVVWRF